MNYEKKYKEALERASNLRKDAVEMENTMTTKTCEVIFPELKESEDERIRRNIIAALKGEGYYDCDLTNECIAWLKKQGEQNYKIIKGKNYFCIKTHNYAGVEWIKGTKYYASDNYTLVNQGCEYYCPEYSKEEHNNLFEEIKCDGCVEKQGNIVEAFRTNTSIEDDVRRRSTIQVLEYARSLDTYNQYGKADIDKNISWLEKQGKQKPFDYENANIQQKDFAPKSALEAIKEEKVDDVNKVKPKDYSSIDPHFGKPIDKIEPKFDFSVGQWIVATGKRIYLITKIDGFNVTLIDVDGNEYVFDTSSLEDAHLWTIQDAKDGDVLIEDSCIFIIQKLGDNSTAAKTYCTLYNDGDFNDGSILYFDIDSTKPATKEQRDTLERAMADAGWEFDFEKKELKKIKLKSDDEVEHLIPQKGIYYTCIKDYYSSDNTHLCIKGNIYKSSFNGYIDDESHFGLSWTNSCAEKYFEPTKDEDWVVCEHDNVIGKPMQYKEFKEKVNQRFIENLKAQGLTPKLRLWNLQDAKDGDVLVVPPIKGSEHSEQVFIFKEIKDREYVKNAVEYYCRCMDNEFAANERGFMGQSDDYFTPATKKQRDILFQKMKEAGYEWNTEKKELKEIENEIEIPFGAKDSELQEATYFIPQGFHAEIDDDKVVIKKGEKPTAWSEEDNMMIEETLYFLREYQHSNRCKDENGMQNSVTCEKWLKSLKQIIGG